MNVTYVEKTGKTVVTHHENVPATLQIQWLKENDQPWTAPDVPIQVTRIVKVADPADANHQLYVEETLLRVIAVDSQGDLAPNVDGVVRIDEQADETFPGEGETVFTTTTNWQFSFQREFSVATDLRPTRPNPSDFTAVPLVSGTTDIIRLRSLAGPRIKKTQLNPDPNVDPRGSFALNWNATVYVCEARHGVACGPGTPPAPHFKPTHEYVEQWLDRQHYSRHNPGGEFSRETGTNGVRDWLEAAVWDAFSDVPLQGGVFAEACNCVTGLQEEPGFGVKGEFASTMGGTQHTISWLPQNFAWDAWRWNSSFGLLQYGLLDALGAVVTSTAVHEARHCWQWSLVLTEGADEDHDLVPGFPEVLDPLALRLKDSPHVWVGGDNPEVHFGGDGGGMASDLGTGVQKTQPERDSEYFEMRAMAGTSTPTILTPQLTAANMNAPGSEPLVISPPGTTMADAIRVTVTGRRGVTTAGNKRFGEYSGGIPEVVLEVEVIPEVGLELTPANTSSGWKKILPSGCSNCTHYVGVTDAAGIAHFDVQGVEVGTYSVRLRVRQLVPAGDTPSTELLLNRLLNVEVR
jgi:hypothetical protein